MGRYKLSALYLFNIQAEIFASWFSIEAIVSLKIKLLVVVELYELRNCLSAISLDCVSFRTRELILVETWSVCPLEPGS